MRVRTSEYKPMDFSTKAKPSGLAIAMAVAALVWTNAANAQVEAGASAVAQGEARTLDDHSHDDHLNLGLGAIRAPAYQGSDTYRTRAFPAVDASWGPLFANSRDGIGVRAIDTGLLTVGAGLTWMQGYKAKYVPDGIGKLKSGAAARGYISVRTDGFVATVGAKKGLSGDNKGAAIDASLAYPIQLSSRTTIIPTVGTTWTNRKYNNRYFGVDADQSLASGLPRFKAGDGFTNIAAALTVNHQLTDRISLGASIGVNRTLGEVKDSPLVSDKTQALGLAFFAYHF